jgi:pSer/pThr/pTyr-binding forkhead associated (FHA) protein
VLASGQAILVTGGPAAGRSVPVLGDVVIGREAREFPLNDPELSRTHAVIRLAGEALEIQDLGSLNGTWVNGTRITSVVPLHPGDIIRIGQTTLEVAGARPTRSAPELHPFVDTGRPTAWHAPASRRLSVTVFSLATVFATAAALVLYFALR